MNNTLIILTKTQLLSVFNINKIKHPNNKSEKVKAITFSAIMALVGLMILGYSFGIAYGYVYLGMANLMPAILMTMTSIIIIVTTIFKCNGILFGYKDYDMIMSLPINDRIIITSKFLVMYITNLIFSMLVMVPAGIIFAVFYSFNIISAIFFIISLFVVPLFPMIISTAIGAFIMFISTKFKYNNIISITLGIILVLLVMVLSFGSSNINNQLVENISTSVMNSIFSTYPLAKLYSNAIVNADLISFIFFVLISVFSFTLFVYLISFKYKSINTALTTFTSKNDYKMQELETSSIFKALYLKELKRYFSSSLYVLNTMIGSILCIAASFALCYFNSMQIEKLSGIQGFSSIIQNICPLFIAAMLSLACTSASSISLEGKNLWILTSSPIPMKAILQSKIAVNLTILLPASIISSILLSFKYADNILDIVLLLVTPIVYCFYTAVVGLYMNLKFPNFEWENEVAPIKQSAAVMLAILAGFAASIIPIILILGLKSINHYLILICFTILTALITLFLYRLSLSEKLG